MLRVFFVLLCFVFQLAIPVAAADETVVVEDEIITLDPTVPVESSAPETIPETTAESVSESAPETVPDAFVPVTMAIDGRLSGGYWFTCNCSLGNNLKFYVPIEWAYDALTLDYSGDPVNLSTSTCYAYCPTYPDYTFSAPRFGTFSYRTSGYETQDLDVSMLLDSNIDFLKDEAVRLSTSDLLHLVCCLLFLLLALSMVLRR